MARPWKPPQVEIEWLDAVNYHTMEGTREDLVVRAKLMLRNTSGYLIHQDGEEVASTLLRRMIIAHDYDRPEEGTSDPPIHGNVTVIPLKWVVKVIYKNRKKKEVPKVPKVSQIEANPIVIEPKEV